MTDLIDRIYFQELAEQNPVEVCRRALCYYDDTDKCYRMSIWGVPYEILPLASTIKRKPEGHERLHPYFDLFAVHYLLNAKEVDPSNRWISEKDIPGGSAFFRGPHEIPTRLIADRFEGEIEDFNKKCEQRMGIPLGLADASFRFQIAPRIPVAVLYWIGDEDFPAESKLLFDRTISDHLASDVVYALAVGVCRRLAESAD